MNVIDVVSVLALHAEKDTVSWFQVNLWVQRRFRAQAFQNQRLCGVGGGGMGRPEMQAETSCFTRRTKSVKQSQNWSE